MVTTTSTVPSPSTERARVAKLHRAALNLCGKLRTVDANTSAAWWLAFAAAKAVRGDRDNAAASIKNALQELIGAGGDIHPEAEAAIKSALLALDALPRFGAAKIGGAS
jgi:hypothetical protein